MTKSRMPEAYIGKEQAYVKHTILRTYLQRLFMIVGQGREMVINYVDCFAGPWKEEDDTLSDTSIGVSLEQMALCQKSLKVQFDRNVRFRALSIEKDPVAFGKLEAFLTERPYPNIETKCLNGDYTELLDEIVSWCDGHFTFFFVDPTGWQNVVGAKTLLPSLKLGKAEFLINLMYGFANRFVTVDRHTEDMIELFGEVPDFENETPEQRQSILLSLYRGSLKRQYGGRTAYVPVEKPGHERVLYYLVYLTRHPKGIDVFKTEAEKMEITQRVLQQEYKLRQQIERSGTGDLFGGEAEIPLKDTEYSDNRMMAKAYLLGHLSEEPTLIDLEKWADFLEESDLYPGDLQMAMKELVKEGRVKNVDEDVSKRYKYVIKPDWSAKSERWVVI